MNLIKWLEKWYQNNCNGEWEQTYGIEIGTLDNPGWYVSVDLSETDYADLQAEEFYYENSENDWIKCLIEEECFKGYGDCSKLDMIIQILKSWIEGTNEYQTAR